jgi:hypothetical protein
MEWVESYPTQKARQEKNEEKKKKTTNHTNDTNGKQNRLKYLSDSCYSWDSWFIEERNVSCSAGTKPADESSPFVLAQPQLPPQP